MHHFPDIIPLFDGFSIAISAQRMLHNKSVGAHQNPSHALPVCRNAGEGVSINVHDDGETMAIIQEIAGHALSTMRDDQAITTLLAQSSWTRRERECYEVTLATLIVRGVRHHAALHMPDDAIGWKDGRDTQFSAIDDDTYYRCFRRAVVTAVALQCVEHILLPSSTIVNGDYKQSCKYYLAPGLVQMPDDYVRWHGWVMSSCSGHVIETMPAVSQSPYRRSRTDYHFADFIAGVPFIDRNGVVYGNAYNNSPKHQTVMHARRGVTDRTLLQWIGALASADLAGCDWAPTIRATVAYNGALRRHSHERLALRPSSPRNVSAGVANVATANRASGVSLVYDQDVARMQNYLAELGYLAADSNERGQINEATTAALQTFQQEHLGIKPERLRRMVYDRATRDALVAQHAQLAARHQAT